MRSYGEVIPPPDVLALLEQLEGSRRTSDLSAVAHWNSHARYLDPVRAWLAERFFGKCAYCETIFGHVGFGNLDHFAPKRYFPAWTYRWQNLVLACQACNTYKSSSFGRAIHPVYGHPENHLTFLLELVEPLTDQGQDQTDQVRLNRATLASRRRSYLRDLAAYVKLGHLRADLADVIATYLAAAVSESGLWSHAAACFLGAQLIAGVPAEPLPAYQEAEQVLTESLLDLGGDT